MKLFSSMSELTPSQRDLSDKVTSACVIGLAGVIVATCLPAQAQRMTGGGGYNIPTNPTRLAPPPAPAQPTQSEPNVRYGVFSPTGPLPVGRVNVALDNSFEPGQIMGYQVYIQDNGRYGNDQIVVLGPAGREEIWANCNVTEEWKSFGPNSEQFIHGVVDQWCGWSS